MTALWVIVACGVLAIVYAVWAIRSVLAADAGNARMQEIAAEWRGRIDPSRRYVFVAAACLQQPYE